MSNRVFMTVNIQHLAGDGILCVLCLDGVFHLYAIHTKLSLGGHRSWLLEHGAYEVGLSIGNKVVAWYLFLVASSLRVLVFI